MSHYNIPIVADICAATVRARPHCGINSYEVGSRFDYLAGCRECRRYVYFVRVAVDLVDPQYGLGERRSHLANDVRPVCPDCYGSAGKG